MDSTTAQLPELHDTFGSMFIGVIISSALWGICCVQTYYYFNHYWDDVWHLKLLVTVACLLDTVHQALIGHTVYSYTITNYFNPAYLNVLVWSLGLQVFFVGLTGFVVQCFFAFRVYRLSQQNRLLTGVLGALIFGEFALTVWYSALALSITTLSEGAVKLKSLSISVNAVGVAADVTIAASLCILLQGSRTGFEKSDSMITRLMKYSVNTGLLTSACAIFALILILTKPATLIYVPFYFAVGRLYSNSMLATLNARKSFKNSLVGQENLDLSAGSAMRKRSNEKRRVSIHVDTQVRRHIDSFGLDIKDLDYDVDCREITPSSARSSTIPDCEFKNTKLDSPA